MFVSWSCYFSLQHTPQWAVCLFGWSWRRQIDSFTQIRTNAHSDTHMPPPHTHTHINIYICIQTETEPVIDGLSDSLFSGLKWTGGQTWCSEAKESSVSRRIWTAITARGWIDFEIRLHTHLHTQTQGPLSLPCNCLYILDSMTISDRVAERGMQSNWTKGGYRYADMVVIPHIFLTSPL